MIGGDVQQKRKSGSQSQAPIHFQKLSDASSKMEIVVADKRSRGLVCLCLEARRVVLA
jgi:hypothetical protein